MLVAWKGIGGGREVMGLNFHGIHYLATETEHVLANRSTKLVLSTCM